MKKVLITGAAGFIGFHLATHLHQRRDEVLGLDQFNDYYATSLKKARAKLLHEWGVEVVTGSVTDKAFLEKVFDEFQPTHVVHLAAQAGVRYSITHPDAYIENNVQGFLNLLEVLKERPNVILTYASSSSVYGNGLKAPYKESDPTERPESLYAVTKKSNEMMAQLYHKLYGIRTTGLRFFTVYGPWGRPDMAYYKFAKAITAGEPIDVYNEGKLERDFTYIQDIVDGITLALDKECACDIFNLGSHGPRPLMQFIHILEETLGKKAELNFLPMQPGDVYTTSADLTHSKKVLGFDPKVPLEEGLGLFAEWFMKSKQS